MMDLNPNTERILQKNAFIVAIQQNSVIFAPVFGEENN
jgi:hypothetical protein